MPPPFSACSCAREAVLWLVCWVHRPVELWLVAGDHRCCAGAGHQPVLADRGFCHQQRRHHGRQVVVFLSPACLSVCSSSLGLWNPRSGADRCFAFAAVVHRYVPDATLPNSGYYTTAKNAVDSLHTYANRVQKSVPAAVAAQPEVDTMNVNIKKFVTASKEVPITVCPTSCLNIGSFYGKKPAYAISASSCTVWRPALLSIITAGRSSLSHSSMHDLYANGVGLAALCLQTP